MAQASPAFCSAQTWPISRQFERAKLELPVEIEVAGQHYRGWSLDICAGGFGMTVAAPLSKSAEITAWITLPGKCAIKVRAVVRHASGFRFGCEFLLISPEDQRAICDHVIKARKPRQRSIA